MRLHQLWDSGDEMREVWKLEDPEVQGARDVAVTPDGTAVYLLEDASNFADYGGEKMRFPQRDMQGKGRLFKYILAPRLERSLPVQIR